MCSLSRVWFFCDPMDCSPPGSSVHVILQARILEWVAIAFSRASSRCRDWTHVPCSSTTDRQILCNWATWESPTFYTYKSKFLTLKIVYSGSTPCFANSISFDKILFNYILVIEGRIYSILPYIHNIYTFILGPLTNKHSLQFFSQNAIYHINILFLN